MYPTKYRTKTSHLNEKNRFKVIKLESFSRNEMAKFKLSDII